MKDYIDELAELREMKDTFMKYAGIMSEFEKTTYKNRISAYRDQIHDQVINGVLHDWNKAIVEYQSKQAAYEAAKRGEAARFDSVKYASEMQAIQTIVGIVLNQPKNPFAGGNGKVEKLQSIYQEAVQSGDLNKKRAVMEVFSNLPEKETLTLARQAKNDLALLRTTEQVIATETEAKQAANDLMVNSRAIVVKAAEILGEPISPFGNIGPLSKALARVRPGANGQLEIQEGE